MNTTADGASGYADPADGSVPDRRVLAGRYELIAPLGTGGMAQVWSATDRSLSRPVAVKILHRHLADDPEFVERFRREAVAAARLVHPNIVAVYDTISEDGCEAIVMELVTGDTLRRVLDLQGRLSDTAVRDLGVDLAGALDCAHRNGVVHRDIKPANILVTSDGSVRLTDFGIAKADDDPDLTTAGTLVGTAAYLAPEQVEGGRVDARTDLYSLGTVLYECLAGQPPFRGDSPAATAIARLHQPPPPLADQVDADASLVAAITRTIAVDPADRFQSADEFGRALGGQSGPGRTPRRAPAPRVTNAAPAAPAADTAAALDRGSSARRQRPLGTMVGNALLAVLLLGPLGVVLALAAVPTDRRTHQPSTTTTPVTALRVVRATSLDPLGDNHAENESAAPRVLDGDAATSWSTESYDSQTFGRKTGVGLVLELAGTSTIDAVRITGSTGWKGSIFVTTAPVPTDAVPSGASTVIDATASATTVGIDRRTGRYVVIWITDLGPSPGRHRVSISDITVRGRPA